MADNQTNSETNNEVIIQGGNEIRRTVQHLPAFYRTDANQRFLASTLDPVSYTHLTLPTTVRV